MIKTDNLATFNIEDIAPTDEYSYLCQELARINAIVNKPVEVYDPDKSSLSRFKNLFIEKPRETGNNKYYFGVVVELQRSVLQPNIVEVYVDVPGINSKKINHPDFFADPKIDLKYFEDMIFYHYDIESNLQNVPILGGIAMVEVSMFYPNHRTADKFGNRYIQMVSETPYVKVKTENRRLTFTKPLFSTMPGQPIQSPLGEQSDRREKPPDSSQQPTSAPLGDYKTPTTTIAEIFGVPVGQIGVRYMTATKEKPGVSKVLIVGDSHTQGSFGEGLQQILTRFGYGTTKVARGGASAPHFNRQIFHLSGQKRVQEFPEAFRDFQGHNKQPYHAAIIALGTNDEAGYIVPDRKGGEVGGAEFIVSEILKMKKSITAKYYFWVLPPLFSDSAAESIPGATYKTATRKDLNQRTDILINYARSHNLDGMYLINLKDMMKPYKAELPARDIHFNNIGMKVGFLVAMHVENFMASGVSTGVEIQNNPAYAAEIKNYVKTK